MTKAMAVLANQMMLPPDQAIALPTAVECAAKKLEITENEFISRLQENPRLRTYVANVCRDASAKYWADVV